jgi:predicted nuclease with TOPRIM domain
MDDYENANSDISTCSDAHYDCEQIEETISKIEEYIEEFDELVENDKILSGAQEQIKDLATHTDMWSDDLDKLKAYSQDMETKLQEVYDAGENLEHAINSCEEMPEIRIDTPS